MSQNSAVLLKITLGSMRTPFVIKTTKPQKPHTCLPSKQHYTNPPSRYSTLEVGLDTPQGNKFPNYSPRHWMPWLRKHLYLLGEDLQIYSQIHKLPDKRPATKPSIYAITSTNLGLHNNRSPSYHAFVGSRSMFLL
jgi:hypothetical protein